MENAFPPEFAEFAQVIQIKGQAVGQVGLRKNERQSERGKTEVNAWRMISTLRTASFKISAAGVAAEAVISNVESFDR